MTDEQGFADKMNSMRKCVVSNTLTDSEVTWTNSTVIRGDVEAEVAKLKAQAGGDLLVAGSAQLSHFLIEHGLVDEYRLMVFPVVLGSGKRLFPEVSDAVRLTLAEAKPTGSGIMLLTYHPA
jgi:dihydrofolate reductase